MAIESVWASELQALNAFGESQWSKLIDETARFLGAESSAALANWRDRWCHSEDACSALEVSALEDLFEAPLWREAARDFARDHTRVQASAVAMVLLLRFEQHRIGNCRSDGAGYAVDSMRGKAMSTIKKWRPWKSSSAPDEGVRELEKHYYSRRGGEIICRARGVRRVRDCRARSAAFVAKVSREHVRAFGTREGLDASLLSVKYQMAHLVQDLGRCDDERLAALGRYEEPARE